MKLSWMNMVYVGKINKLEFADAVMLTFISVKLSLDHFLSAAWAFIVDDWSKLWGMRWELFLASEGGMPEKGLRTIDPRRCYY